MSKRELLFRGKKSKNEPYPGEWVEGGYVEYGNVQSVIVTKGRYGDNIQYEVDPETLCQYTGRNDAHGNRVFEGDILKLTRDWGGGDISSWIGIVKFGSHPDLNSWGWQLERISGERGFDPDFLMWIGEYADTLSATSHIIGNIYDNPELMQ